MTSYAEIRESMRGRIIGGEWAPGDLIPNEEDLARAYTCARTTVNRALRELAAEGLLDRRRRAGTRVARARSQSALIEIPLMRAEIEAAGQRYGYRLLNCERGVGAVAPGAPAWPELPPDTPVLRIRCLHYADDQPHQLEDRWISLDAVPEAEAADFSRRSPNEWLLREVPWSESEHAFSAALPARTEARLLELPAMEPVFVIDRRTWAGGRPVTRARLLHPGRDFRLVSRSVAAAA